MSRQCASCGQPEQRKTDSFGRVSTNLEPLSGLCVPCLIHTAKQAGKGSYIVPELPADYKHAAAGEREDRE